MQYHTRSCAIWLNINTLWLPMALGLQHIYINTMIFCTNWHFFFWAKTDVSNTFKWQQLAISTVSQAFASITILLVTVGLIWLQMFPGPFNMAWVFKWNALNSYIHSLKVFSLNNMETLLIVCSVLSLRGRLCPEYPWHWSASNLQTCLVVYKVYSSFIE